MGSVQCKCSCGSYSQYKITIDSVFPITGLDTIYRISGYKGWTSNWITMIALPCDKCVVSLTKNLRLNNIIYSREKSTNGGYYKTDLP